MTLDDLLDNLKDEASFLEFARALQADKEDETKKKEKIQAILTAQVGMDGKTHPLKIF